MDHTSAYADPRPWRAYVANEIVREAGNRFRREASELSRPAHGDVQTPPWLFHAARSAAEHLRKLLAFQLSAASYLLQRRRSERGNYVPHSGQSPS